MDNLSKTVVIAVTGGIACGKSEVGRILHQMNFAVCDADQIAHELMARGTPVHQRLVEHFGPRILTGDGEISRAVLGGIVFENPAERDCLNRMVHPAVKDALAAWIAERRSCGECGAAQVPLLYESGMGQLDWDAVVCVSSRPELVYERLEQRGLGREEAAMRIESQMAVEKKEQLSDHVIYNLGTLQELEQETRSVVGDLLTER